MKYTTLTKKTRLLNLEGLVNVIPKVNFSGLFIIGILLLGLVGCKKTSTIKPINAKISKEKMVPILRDVHMAEALLQGHLTDKRDSMAAVYYHSIFTIHEVIEEDFYSSLSTYKDHPKTIESIYEKVLEALNQQKLAFDKAEPAKKNRN